VLATIHRLLRTERKRLRPRIVNLGFDREHHTRHPAPFISVTVLGTKTKETEISVGGRKRPQCTAL